MQLRRLDLSWNDCGIALRPGAFSLTPQGCGSRSFAHELGHNMGLQHDRYQVHHREDGLSAHPAYGYVNQRGVTAGARRSTRWLAIMAYRRQCSDVYAGCSLLLRFSNPGQSYNGDPLGIPFGRGSGVTGPSDAVAVLNSTGPAVAAWRDSVSRGPNRPPAAVGALPDRTLALNATLDVDVSQAFVDPDGDALGYTVSSAFREPEGDALTFAATSSAPEVAAVTVSGSTVTATAVAGGTAAVTVTATDTGGSNLSATQAFMVTVSNRRPEPVGTLAPLTLGVDETAAVEVAPAFRDAEGDRLTYEASSSAPEVASVSVSGSTVTVEAVTGGTAAVTVTATDPGGSNQSVARTFAVTVSNRRPEPVGTLGPLKLLVGDLAETLDVAEAFRDPEGDALTYEATSSAPGVASVAVSGSRVTVTALAGGTVTVTVTATDAGGSNRSATQTFAVKVPVPFTDDPLVSGVTPVKAIHFTELRMRIDALRGAAGLTRFRWSDPVLTAGVTPVRLAHLLELRAALAAAYAAAGPAAPGWSDVAPVAGATPIRAVHLMELRAAVIALE